MIEGDASMARGAPLSVPISDGAIVVLQITDADNSGEITFSYRIDALDYSWYQKYTVGADHSYNLAL